MPLSILISLPEALCIAAALSLDAFAAGFSYGAGRIRIPLSSVVVIDAICSISVGATLLLGSLLKNHIPVRLTGMVCFVILFLLGLVKLLDGITKSVIRKYGAISSNIRFSFCNFRFVLSLYADPECADIDHSKTISPREAAALAVALSLDGCAVGFGTALGNVNGIAVFFCSLVTEALAVICGVHLGNKAAGKLSCNLSWAGDLILLILAFVKLFA